VGCEENTPVGQDANQQETQPLITNNPIPTGDLSRTGSNLHSAVDPNAGIASPNGVPGNEGGR
jgi:hypothetical protein